MKEPYIWDYTIKVKTKTGEYTYEKETLDNIDMLLQKHPDYTGIEATHTGPKEEKGKQLVKKITPRK
jgi:hypothetical protein